MNPKKLVMRFGIASPRTGLALDQSVGSMELDRFFRASQRVDPVDVLGDNGANFPSLFQSDDRLVYLVRFRSSEGRPCLEFVIPMFDPGAFRAHEIVIIDRRPSGPDTAWSTEVRDAAGRGYACAGEDKDPSSLLQVVD